MKSGRGLSRRGVSVILIGLLAVGALGIGSAGAGNSASTAAFGIKKAKRLFFTKKKANKRFLAKPRYIDLPVTGANFDVTDPNVEYDRGNTGNFGLELKAAGGPTSEWSWTLPAHFPAGAAHRITFFWNSFSTSCTFNFQANTFARNKVGANSVGSQNNLTNPPGNTLNAPADNTVVGTAVISIPGTINGVQAANGVVEHISVFRSAGQPNDTCGGSLKLLGARVSW